MNRRAFTLLELMIAIALGSLIIYVAVAGFRVAATSITVTNRLALENDLLRSGCLDANERLDYWTDFDDPDNPAEQRLRGRDGDGGLPFTPMSLVFPLTRNAIDPEKSTGWDPEETWKASDPRMWWQGNVAEKWNSEMLLGRYSIFGNSQPPVIVTGAATNVVLNGSAGVGTYGTVSVPHEWQYRQIWGMYGALGYFGFTDYLPQNTLFACYNEFFVPPPPNPPYSALVRATNQDGMPLVLFRPGSSFDNGEGIQQYPKGLWRLTMASSYGVVSPTRANANQSAAHRRRYTTGYWNNSGDLRRFLDDTENRRPFTAMPSHWPRIEVTTQHFIKTGRYVNLGKVQLSDPISGAVTEIVFSSFSTTLRGARLQRRHDGGGWADHDNGTGATVPPTLDHTPVRAP